MNQLLEPRWFRYWPESPDGSFWVEWREVTTQRSRLVYRWGDPRPIGREWLEETTTATAVSQLGRQYFYAVNGNRWELLSGGKTET